MRVMADKKLLYGSSARLTEKNTHKWTILSKIFRVKICGYAYRIVRLFFLSFIRLLVYSVVRLFVCSVIRLCVSNFSFIRVRLFVYLYQLSK